MSYLSSKDPGHPSKQQNCFFSSLTFHKDPLILGMSAGRKNKATLGSPDWLPPWYCSLRFFPAWGLRQKTDVLKIPRVVGGLGDIGILG